MRSKVFYTILAAILITSFDIKSQDLPLVLDLSDDTPKDGAVINVKPFSGMKIILANLIPGKKYYYHYESRIKEIPYLTFDKIPEDTNETRGDDECKTAADSLVEALNKLNNANSESEVKTLKSEIDKQIKIIRSDNDCFTIYETSLIKKAENLLSRTEETINITERLRQGEEMIITINRSGEKEWKFILDSGERGRWMISYGAAYISNIFKQHKEFAVRQVSNDSCYVTVLSKDRDEGDLTPSVFYTWLPAAYEGNNWVFGLSGGLGFDMSSPVVMAGVSVMYCWNLNLILGVSGRIVKRPSVKYQEFQLINASDAESLNRNTASFSPFLALTFRFESNPFAKSKK